VLLSSVAASSELSASSASGLSSQAENSTSLFELCLQDGAAERRFRVVLVSTLPDAAKIIFDSSRCAVAGVRLRGYVTVRLLFLFALAFFINPIGASEVDPGCIDFKPGD